MISQDGEQLGVLTLAAALQLAQEKGLDLVEIVPTASPPVCKIIDRGKFRYDQTKREKESRKSQHQAQTKVKELKFSPNTGDHDLEVKIGQAREFLEKGHKVKITCTFRGREMAHPEVGQKQLARVIDALGSLAVCEMPAKMLGRQLTVILASAVKKKR